MLEWIKIIILQYLIGNYVTFSEKETMTDLTTVVINQIKETFFRHKTRIETLEERIAYLERRIQQLESESTNPWKMPFD